MSLIFSAFARQMAEKRVRTNTSLSHKQWVKIDRIVITFLFIAVIIGAIFFS
ncbi:hypothetical protein AAKU52_001088 [Pedobacter sp. CG_S7]